MYTDVTIGTMYKNEILNSCLTNYYLTYRVPDVQDHDHINKYLAKKRPHNIIAMSRNLLKIKRTP